jgi:acyl-CoA reductase-like NAD-dependent aldehyde dehydrogenase
MRPTFESRMLIDGWLVDGQAGVFENVNPATQEVLGAVADASKADMHRAIDAARRAFDETDWSRDHGFRQRCLEQLQAGLEAAPTLALRRGRRDAHRYVRGHRPG